jgi:putative transcriptional regulator
MNKEIYTINDYGTITINIRKYMEKENISRNALANAINTRFEVVNKWYNGHVEKIDADVLARICYVLNCMPGDIIDYSIPTQR